ncbi:acyltransferase family protein [Pyxidicoccus fallax]|uniref:Acyltransferase family protein n=1 Tax=Pyxidicoccus fallax TaxID=394095 RepID=A0A848LYV9_9BACT|nr:acyltransferase family protein [Pyxidicoccus fallax]NMO22722.1 acyltransferase family protein [Pyxidicoccus fallax]NPC84833.1 acyltransferase family protein [Pyxidicoccus fallax]
MSTDATPRTAGGHRPELDWLRVVAILVLHLFHTGMMFNTWDWHVKSAQALPVLEPVMEVLHHVRMPLLMFISGVGTALALGRRSLGAFASDRVKRLLWPLVFGIFVVVPPQIYVEQLFRGRFQGGYAEFYPSVFDLVPYPAGSFSWHHLWFVAYLFAYCMLALPLFAALGTARGQAVLSRVEEWLCRGWNVAWLFAPLALNGLLLHGYPETHALFDDPRTFGHYGLLFLLGHVLGRCPRVWDHLVERRRALLAASGVLFAIMVPESEFPLVPEVLGAQAALWLFILTALAWARACIRVRRPWLKHAQELSYPFYILHQTVIVVVGYAFLSLPVGPWALFGLVLVTTFGATWALSEGIARMPWLRPCFGMKPRATRAGAPRMMEAGHTG